MIETVVCPDNYVLIDDNCVAIEINTDTGSAEVVD